MLDLLKQKITVTNDGVAVHERPPVQEAKRALDQARTKWTEAKARLGEIEKLLNPAPETSSSRLERPDEIAIIRARAGHPQAQLAYWETDVLLKTAEQVFQKTVEEEKTAVTLARSQARRGLVQQLFARLEEAKAVAEEIADYDLETAAQGGTAQMHPFGELLDETHRTGLVTFRRQLFEKEGAL